jgi:hypothetical protein
MASFRLLSGAWLAPPALPADAPDTYHVASVALTLEGMAHPEHRLTLKGSTEGGTVLRFVHKGYDPPGFHHLMTHEEGAILENGSVERRKALLKRNCSLDSGAIHVFDNSCTNVARKATFTSPAGDGAQSKGWSGTVDIFDLLSHDPVVPDWVVEEPGE